MEEDVIVLLDYVGWTDERQLQVVGTSLGGMIAMGQYFTMSFRYSYSSLNPLSGFRIGDTYPQKNRIIDLVCDHGWREALDQLPACKP